MSGPKASGVQRARAVVRGNRSNVTEYSFDGNARHLLVDRTFPLSGSLVHHAPHPLDKS